MYDLCMIIYIICNRSIDGSIYTYIDRLSTLVINRNWSPSHHRDAMNFEDIAAPVDAAANLHLSTILTLSFRLQTWNFQVTADRKRKGNP